MKKFLGAVFGIVIAFLGVPLPAAADTASVPIHLTIQTFDKTLFDGDISVEACFNSQRGPTTTVNAFCAVTQVASSSGWTIDAMWSKYGVFVNSINAYAPTSLSGPYWLYYANGESALTGLDAHILTSGEHILLTFGISPMRVVAASSSPLVGTTTILSAQYFDADLLFDWTAATNTTFIVNGVPMAGDAKGNLAYIPTSTSTVTISAEAQGHIRSEAITLTPYKDTPPQSTLEGTIIHLDIETYDGVLYDNDVKVYPCPDTQFGTTTTVNAFCAVKQVASSSAWTLATTWYSFGESLDGINSYTADFANSRYWLYYTNRELAQVGLGAHVITKGEEILLTFGTSPLRVVVATTSPHIGEPVVLASQTFDANNAFDWVAATGTTFIVNGIATSSDAEGKLTLIATSTAPIVIAITKGGLVGSKSVTLTPVAVITIPSSPAASLTASGGGSTPEQTHNIDISKAIQYLQGKQNTDGSFAAPLYTDWAAIGLSGITGADDMRAKLKSYLITHTDPGSLLTDAERRAMALEALGIDPAIGTTRNYIADITSRFDGTQFGDTNEVNDDMFALIALAHAGYDATDAHIAAAVSFIISKQSVSGSWGSVDLTAAGMLALAPFRTLPGVTAAIDKAKSSLHAAQQADGGFGSSFATSWVLNAINGLSGEVLSRDWSKGGRTPADYLWLLQQTDGGIGEPSLDTNSRVWATAYALTGGSGKDWNAVLGSFSRHVSGATQSGGGGGEVLGATTASSSETKSATSTEVSTKATLVIATASSTEQLMLTDTVGTTSASTSLSKATSTPSKAKGGKIKKKIIPKEIMKQTASVTSAAPTVPVAPMEDKKEDKGIASFIRDPFARFFKFVGSWF